MRTQRGFTLIELLVVIAILGILAAIAIPSVSRFMGSGKKEAAVTENHNVQTAVLASLVDSNRSTILDGVTDGSINFGDADGNPDTSESIDCMVSSNSSVGEYIVGGAGSVTGSYSIEPDGTVHQEWYPLD